MSENERFVVTGAQLDDLGDRMGRWWNDGEGRREVREWLAEQGITPEPGALHDAAVKAAREWYGRVTALQPLPIQPGTLEHVIILKGRDAAEWHFAAQVRSFRVQFEIETQRLIDAATAALGRAEGAAGREG